MGRMGRKQFILFLLNHETFCSFVWFPPRIPPAAWHASAWSPPLPVIGLRQRFRMAGREPHAPPRLGAAHTRQGNFEPFARDKRRRKELLR
jgi:hypothetical protein